MEKTKLAVIGAGRGGTTLIKIFSNDSDVVVVGVANRSQDAEGVKLAREKNIPVFNDFRDMLAKIEPDIVIDASGNDDVANHLKKGLPSGVEILHGRSASLIWRMVDEHQRIEDNMKRSIAEQHALYHIGVMLAGFEKVDQALEAILDSAMELTGMTGGSLALFDEEKGEMTVKTVGGFTRNHLSSGYRWKLRPGGVTGKILSNQIPTVIPDTTKESELDMSMISALGTMSMIAVPLIIEGKIVGILYVDDTVARIFTEREVNLLSLLGTQAAAAIEKTRLLERAEKQATTDELTKLCNHRQFMKRLVAEFGRSKRYGHPLSVMMIDVDHFKHYNDKNGHLKGNHVLTTAAYIMVESTRGTDIVARYGGEEFVVILTETDRAGAVYFAERVRQNISNYVFDNEASQPGGDLTVSIGVATFPGDSDNYTDLLDCADQALYVSKASGRNRVTAYAKNRDSDVKQTAKKKSNGKQAHPEESAADSANPAKPAGKTRPARKRKPAATAKH